jgi:hypothetical protein
MIGFVEASPSLLILRDNELLDEDSDDFPLIEPKNDKEIRPVQVLKSTILTYKPVSERFTHHSSWNRLVNDAILCMMSSSPFDKTLQYVARL